MPGVNRPAGEPRAGAGEGEGVLVLAATPIGRPEDAPPRLATELARADVEQRMLKPGHVRFLARDDVLIRVVDVVVRDVARSGFVLQQQREALDVEVPDESLQVGWSHAFCFSLQVMQTRVHGMAFRRAGAIGSPQSRQIP